MNEVEELKLALHLAEQQNGELREALKKLEVQRDWMIEEIVKNEALLLSVNESSGKSYEQLKDSVFQDLLAKLESLASTHKQGGERVTA